MLLEHLIAYFTRPFPMLGPGSSSILTPSLPALPRSLSGGLDLSTGLGSARSPALPALLTRGRGVLLRALAQGTVPWFLVLGSWGIAQLC